MTQQLPWPQPPPATARGGDHDLPSARRKSSSRRPSVRTNESTFKNEIAHRDLTPPLAPAFQPGRHTHAHTHTQKTPQGFKTLLSTPTAAEARREPQEASKRTWRAQEARRSENTRKHPRGFKPPLSAPAGRTGPQRAPGGFKTGLASPGGEEVRKHTRKAPQRPQNTRIRAENKQKQNNKNKQTQQKQTNQKPILVQQ